MKNVDEIGDTVSAINAVEIVSDKSCSKKRNLFIIIGAILVIAVVLTVVLCLCLPKKSDNENQKDQTTDEKKEEDPVTPTDETHEDPEGIKNNVDIEVYSDTDDKEIEFLSNEYQIGQSSLRNLAEGPYIYVDGNKTNFTKSMKLPKGDN